MTVRCLVTGATGYIGGRLAPRLLAEGHQVRCLARKAGRLRDVPWAAYAEVVEGDLRKPETLPAAFEGVDVAYYLVHSLGQADFEAADREAATHFAAAAAAAGVRRIVYLGGPEPAAGGEVPSPHLRSRAEVARILLAGGVPTVVLRAAVIIGSGSASFEMLRYLTERLPAMVTPAGSATGSSRSPSGTCCATWSAVPPCRPRWTGPSTSAARTCSPSGR